MRKLPLLCLLGIVLAVYTSGCSGQTDYADNITSNSATSSSRLLGSPGCPLPRTARYAAARNCWLKCGSKCLTCRAANPSFAAWQHYDSPVAWAAANVERLKSWGFTTLGGWSDYKIVEHSGEHDLRVAVRVRPGAECRGHQRVRIEVAAEVELLVGLP